MVGSERGNTVNASHYTQGERGALFGLLREIERVDDASGCRSFEFGVLIAETSRIETLRARREAKRLKERSRSQG